PALPAPDQLICSSLRLPETGTFRQSLSAGRTAVWAAFSNIPASPSTVRFPCITRSFIRTRGPTQNGNSDSKERGSFLYTDHFFCFICDSAQRSDGVSTLAINEESLRWASCNDAGGPQSLPAWCWAGLANRDHVRSHRQRFPHQNLIAFFRQTRKCI